MPFIHIRSLPPAEAIDREAELKWISKNFAQACGIDLKHISATWSYFDGGAYVAAGESAAMQPDHRLPVLVTYLAPDFGDKEKLAEKLTTVAGLVAEAADVEVLNVFVHYSPAYSGGVFDGGEIVEW